MHRVYLESSKNGSFEPVLFQHGVEDSSYEWVINSADKAPAFQFARAGYDVWLGNNRGSDFSKNHTTLKTDQPEFWEFDFEEMGLYDVPAEIDYILNLTKFDKIAAYVGHSEGTSQFFIGASLKADYYKEKVGISFLLAPIARLDHTTISALRLLAKPWAVSLLNKAIKSLHLYDLMPNNPSVSILTSSLCKALPSVCDLITSGFWDPDSKIDNLSRVADKMSKSPFGTGYRCIIHYGQILADKQFQRFDFGKKRT